MTQRLNPHPMQHIVRIDGGIIRFRAEADKKADELSRDHHKVRQHRIKTGETSQ